MLNTTYDAIKAVLKADPSIPTAERNQLLTAARNGIPSPKTEPASERVERIIRRREAAARLGCSVRTVDKLAATGSLQKRKLPGRARAAGFLESDLITLLTQKDTSV